MARQDSWHLWYSPPTAKQQPSSKNDVTGRRRSLNQLPSVRGRACSVSKPLFSVQRAAVHIGHVALHSSSIYFVRFTWQTFAKDLLQLEIQVDVDFKGKPAGPRHQHPELSLDAESQKLDIHCSSTIPCSMIQHHHPQHNKRLDWCYSKGL